MGYFYYLSNVGGKKGLKWRIVNMSGLGGTRNEPLHLIETVLLSKENLCAKRKSSWQ